ncbi:MAG: lysophospholipid acyltransferase family protein, partial [Bacteroidia bacterium]
MKNSILYNALHSYVRLCSKLYFNKLHIKGLNNIPKNGPVIFASNHQNAFLDAILIHVTQPRHPHFLTRGDVFNNPIANKVLRSLKMRPIFRFRDGLKNVKRNQGTFSECYHILESGLALGVFPEGNHDLRFNLRPLQKGTARIVFDTESRNDFKLNIKIIPVGIQYYANQNARSDVLIQFGEPICSSDFAEFKLDEKTYHQTLTERIKAKMAQLIINIPIENYDRIKRKWLMERQHIYPLIKAFEKDIKLINQESVTYTNEPKKYKWLLKLFSSHLKTWLFFFSFFHFFI